MITAIVLVFVLGYLAIATEHNIRVNKAASALLTGVICWTLYAIITADHHQVTHELMEHIGDISGILFFLMGAMTIVELIDAHDGFEILTNRIKTRDQRKLMWILSILTFFLSAVLDNLTTTIVMVTLIRKILPEGKNRLLFASMIVIAANAGGAWSPIGDVTTTMLWIGGQITSGSTIVHLILPSIICMMIPLLLLQSRIRGNFVMPEPEDDATMNSTESERNLVFGLGVTLLILVPVFKSVTHLPPYMGILGALGIMWIVTSLIHYHKDEEDKDRMSVMYALRKIDMPSILFFLGILLAIGVLQITDVLSSAALWMNAHIPSVEVVVMSIGILSSIVDNVPLVAAAMGMFDMTTYPVDHFFWLFLAYCAGTGGSMLIIGSAAGVAAMGIEKINFAWYLRHITWLALVGFFAGALAYIAQVSLLN